MLNQESHVRYEKNTFATPEVFSHPGGIISGLEDLESGSCESWSWATPES